jgi:hypothetical protein
VDPISFQKLLTNVFNLDLLADVNIIVNGCRNLFESKGIFVTLKNAKNIKHFALSAKEYLSKEREIN